MREIFTLILLLFVNSNFAQPSNGFPPEDNGITIGFTRKIFSVVLSEDRYLNIYLPPDYKISDTIKYPVIYLLDGGIDEDFLHIAGLVQFCTFPWVDRLPPSILVGIVNSDRKKDFTFPTSIKSDKEQYSTSGSSEKFIAFLEKNR